VPESAAAQTVFFGLDEDVNAKAMALLEPGAALPAPDQAAAPAPEAGQPANTGAPPEAAAETGVERKAPNQETPKP
jgi:hypothetical protein